MTRRPFYVILSMEKLPFLASIRGCNMTTKRHPQKFLWRLLRAPPRLLYKLGLGPIYGRLVLLLTTIGRKSGLPHVTPLQYEEIDGKIYVASARGQGADWFRNIVANPKVAVQVKSRRFTGQAKPITDPVQIANFLALRLRRHPRIIGAILRMEGLPTKPSRAQLEEYAKKRAMVIIQPWEQKL